MRRSDSSTEMSISLGKGSQNGLGNVLENGSGFVSGIGLGKRWVNDLGIGSVNDSRNGLVFDLGIGLGNGLRNGLIFICHCLNYVHLCIFEH